MKRLHKVLPPMGGKSPKETLNDLTADWSLEYERKEREEAKFIILSALTTHRFCCLSPSTYDQTLLFLHLSCGFSVSVSSCLSFLTPFPCIAVLASLEGQLPI